MRRLALLALVALAAGCGGETETEGAESVFVPPPPPGPESFAAADTFDFFPEADDLALDSTVAEDSVEAEAPPPAAPSFAPFLARFKQALQSGDASRHAAPGVDLGPLMADPTFRQRVLATPPDRFRREGTRREAWVVVGFDLDGNVVPEDEAETESGLGLVFDVVDGAYRLVRVDVAG